MLKRFFAFLNAQRDADRRMLIDIMETFAARQDQNTALLVEQTKLLQAITNLYAYTGQPTTWTVRDEDEAKDELARLGLTEEISVDTEEDM